MKAYDFVHLVLHAAGGRVEGRTKLQKLVYFAGVLTNKLEDLGYRPHFYGPYSSQVSSAVDELRSLGFLEQRISGGGSYDPKGFEVARYDYELTSDGRAIADEKAQTGKDLWESIQAAVQKLERADIRDYTKLSIAAKAYYLAHHSLEPVSVVALVETGEQFGWKVSHEQALEAAKWLESLELAESTG